MGGVRLGVLVVVKGKPGRREIYEGSGLQMEVVS
jgi:hypothetical protein